MNKSLTFNIACDNETLYNICGNIMDPKLGDPTNFDVILRYFCNILK